MTDLDALKWEQRVRPNGDVIAILAVADFRALVERVREAEANYEVRSDLIEARAVSLTEALEEIIRQLQFPVSPADSDVVREIAETAVGRGCNACWGVQCDECPLDEAGYHRTVARKASAEAQYQ